MLIFSNCAPDALDALAADFQQLLLMLIFSNCARDALDALDADFPQLRA